MTVGVKIRREICHKRYPRRKCYPPGHEILPKSVGGLLVEEATVVELDATVVLIVYVRDLEDGSNMRAKWEQLGANWEQIGSRMGVLE